MRVLLTTDTIGGVWTFTKELTEHLLIRGDDVALVSFGRAPSAQQSAWVCELTERAERCFEFHACNAPLEWMQNNDLAWSEGAEMLTAVAEKFKPDVFHSSQFCWGALRLEVPRLITAHSDVRSWAKACRPEALVPSAWINRYDALVQGGIDCADALVAPTEWMRDALRSHFNVKAPLHIIANGRTQAKPTVERVRKLGAVCVGRLWDVGKGLSTLNEIVSPMPIVVVGERCFEDAEDSVARSFTCLGTLDEDSLLELLCASSVYLATSLYEPFGLAPLEGAICGCAIVARDIPSLREVWGDAAVYFEDAPSLQAALTDLKEDSDRLRRMQFAAEERASLYTAHRMAAGYASLYRELIASWGDKVAAVEKVLHAA